MAILYGTQSNGETLPVLVDQFGNLLAKGIEGEPGQPGPPGPPGIGELPPDPYEGAVLGWEDGELAWVGNFIILPAGTFGPYTYISAAKRLDIPQDASALVNGQQLFMSDDQGNRVNEDIATDLITNVSGTSEPRLTFQTSKNFDKFVLGEAVQSDWNQRQEWSNLVQGTLNTSDGQPATALFNGVIGTGYQNGVTPVLNTAASIEFGSDFATATSVTIYGYTLAATSANSVLIINGVAVDFPGSDDSNTTYALDSGLQSIEWRYNSDPASYIYLLGIEVDGKLLVDKSVFDPAAARILAIENATNIIVMSGGSWKGTDGSGDQPNGSPDVHKINSGDGSVEVGTNGLIELRADNGEWIDGFYVTAPEQRIAARKVAATARRLRKN